MSLLVWIIGFVVADMLVTLSLCEMMMVLGRKAQFECYIALCCGFQVIAKM